MKKTKGLIYLFSVVALLFCGCATPTVRTIHGDGDDDRKEEAGVDDRAMDEAIRKVLNQMEGAGIRFKPGTRFYISPIMVDGIPGGVPPAMVKSRLSAILGPSGRGGTQCARAEMAEYIIEASVTGRNSKDASGKERHLVYLFQIDVMRASTSDYVFQSDTVEIKKTGSANMHLY